MEQERSRASTWHGPARACMLYAICAYKHEVNSLLVSKDGQKCRQPVDSMNSVSSRTSLGL
jgi:hypothetical protein